MSVLTITAPATERKLCMLDAVKAELGIAQDDITQDAALTERILDASAAIEEHCGRVFALEGVEEALGCPTGEEVLLARIPVVAIGSLTLAGDALGPADYRLDAEAGLLARVSGGRSVSWGGVPTIVTYTAGYSLLGTAGATLPRAVSRACTITAASMWQNKGRNLAVRSETAQDVGSRSYRDPERDAGDLPAEAAALLERYVMVRL